ELKRKFHRQGLVWKMLSVLPLAVVFALTFKGWCILQAGLAFSFFAACGWWYGFDVWLNQACKLDPYYIGKSAAMDTFLQGIATKHRLTNAQAIRWVKLPLLAIAFLLCMLVIVSC